MIEKFLQDNILNFLQCYPGCIFLKDKEGRYIYSSEICNHVAADGVGSIIGKNELEAQINADLGREYYQQDIKLLKEGGSLKYISEVKNDNGFMYYEINKSAVLDDYGNIVGIIGTVVDVTKEYLLKKQVEKALYTDPITGLYNNMFLEHLRKETELTYPLSLIVGDCNFLKQINDTYGHEKGDELLKNTAKIIRESIPDNCYPIRTGGDEFLILCNQTDEEDAKRYINEIQQKSKEISICGIELSIALGTCTMNGNDITFDECRNCADERMYENKKSIKAEFWGKVAQNNKIYNAVQVQRILDQIPVILFFKDTECRYQYINSFDECNLKNDKKETFGIGCTDFELQKDATLAKEYYEDDLKVLKTGMGSVLTKSISNDNGVSCYQIIKSAVRDQNNKITGIVGAVIDITDVKADL